MEPTDRFVYEKVPVTNTCAQLFQRYLVLCEDGPPAFDNAKKIPDAFWYPMSYFQEIVDGNAKSVALGIELLELLALSRAVGFEALQEVCRRKIAELHGKLDSSKFAEIFHVSTISPEVEKQRQQLQNMSSQKLTAASLFDDEEMPEDFC